jgi:hypothetical protein
MSRRRGTTSSAWPPLAKTTAVCKAQAAQHAGILKARPVAQHLNLVAHSQCGTQAERRLPQKLTLRHHELARARVGVACW